ncbi:MAG: MTAP family purine nucleoside phosphorylase [Deltaproteobacteria bacterium]|nr:MTAP family purine nucleoside phosphorylase [Deltaproteobacteria bacterium]
MRGKEKNGGRVVGVIGGSGLYRMGGLEHVSEVRVETPFGRPSDVYVKGSLGEVEMIFLPRHGKGHRWLPTEVNFRANIYGMKKLGVERIISVSAVGSLREEIAPGHVVIPDQFIDRTTRRASTFFGGGVVAHVGFADPFCAALCEGLARAAQGAGAQVHPGGTYLCMEGPQFSTRAESELYRSWGAHVIGMTNLQEAKLVSDNVKLAQRIIRGAVRYFPPERSCACATALKDAIITERAKIPKKARKELKLIIGKYL